MASCKLTALEVIAASLGTLRLTASVKVGVVIAAIDLDVVDPNYFSNLTQALQLNPSQFGIYT